MTIASPTHCTAGTIGGRAAADNWAVNARALRTTQPRLPGTVTPPDGLTWTYGRDGALTALHSDGSWWAGCSLPKRAARSILKTLEAGGRVACFLSPAYAAQVRVALDTLRADQAIIAICPRSDFLAVLLHCEDFAADISAHRLWFAWGEQWSQELDRLLDENIGLPTPAQFIRPAAADHSEADALIPIAEKIFNAQNARRMQSDKPRRQSWKPSGRETPRICLMAPSHFRLWDDGGHVLAEMCGGEADIVRFDSDDPASASPSALAGAAMQCDAVLAVNLARENLHEVVPDEMPWVTWVVRQGIPAGAAAGRRDALIVADARWRRDVIAGGWAADRVEVGAWPIKPTAEPWALRGREDAPAAHLALIADTRSLDAPRRIVDLSSQHLLWDAMAAEVVENPFVVAGDADQYLRRRQGELRIPDDGLDRDLFIELLLTPAFQQGIARLLLREKLPIRLYGVGWDSIEEFTDIAAGAIRSRQELAEATQSAAALIYAWPIPRAHPIDAFPRPILRLSAGQAAFLASARKSLEGGYSVSPPARDVFNWSSIIRLVHRLRNR